MIKESGNMIAREAKLATPIQKWYSPMLLSFDDYLSIQ